ncbi:hypothetical protein NM688_g7015 [Phlebia brevispora]|uniref:Uncharacterized protein n=1 Tax=Phlebia brevispora TaxID=194682 RepID=A0ACC1S9V4_9APHY|nr:hypothetical protein NM688_g7015 [Phlebia brevispora]
MASAESPSTATPAPKSAASALTLYIWPPYESALSIDPSCVAALLYLQAVFPGHFAVVHSNDPDASPSGQLPYLTHGLRRVASFESIVKYVSRLEGVRQLDTSLSVAEKAQATARIAHVEAELGDFVAHVYYALSTNWTERIHPMLVSLLPVPQRYFLPKRIRESYRPRLEAVELWSAEGVADEEEEEKIRFAFRRATRKTKKQAEEKKKRHLFARDKVLEKARAFFDIYTKLLGDNTYFYSSEIPTTLDIVLAAHIHLLQQPLPDSLLRDLLAESYPQLLEHAHEVYEYAFNPALPTPPTTPHRLSFSLSFILPSPPAFWGFWSTDNTEETDTSDGAKEVKAVRRRFTTYRWGFFAAVLAAFGAYLAFSDTARQLLILSDESQRLSLLNPRVSRKGAIEADQQEGAEGDEVEDGEEYEEEDE